MRAAGDTVAPASAPPLRLPPPRWRTTGWRRRLPWRGWAGWLTPLAAATAVAATVALIEVSPLVIGGGAGGARPEAWSRGIPPYYVMLSYANPRLPQNGSALVRNTASGRLLAAVGAPRHGTFTAVTAAANDNNWVLAARVPAATPVYSHTTMTDQGISELRFFQATYQPAAKTVNLSMLPVAAPSPTASLTGLAVSPNGSKLAMSVTTGYRSQIRVVTLATGRAQTWSGTTPGQGRDGRGANWVTGLSWAADNRTLAYDNIFNVRVLDTEAPVTSLKLDSANGIRHGDGGVRVTTTCAAALVNGWPTRYYGNAVLTPESDLIIASGGYRPGKSAVATIPPGLWQTGQLAYPCTTGAWREVRSRLQTVHYGKLTGAVRWVYWASPNGGSLIVRAYFGLGGRGLVGVLRGSSFTPLPQTGLLSTDPAAAISSVAW